MRESRVEHWMAAAVAWPEATSRLNDGEVAGLSKTVANKPR